MILMPSRVDVGGLSVGAFEDSGVQWTLVDVSGLGATAGTLAPVQRPRAAGSWAGASFAKSRVMVVKGSLAAPSTAAAVDALDRLNMAFSLNESSMAVMQSGVQRTYLVRRDGDVLPKWLNPSAFDFSVQVIALDSRGFGVPLSGSTGLPASSGGLTVPFTVPFTVAASSVSGVIALTNPGNTIGPVLLRIDGPVAGPIITHQGVTGGQIAFASSLVLNAGEFLLIDMERRSVLAQGQSTRAQYITARGWFGFDPGVNTFAFAASSYNPQALLTVQASPAWG